jgi:hypothetical protein
MKKVIAILTLLTMTASSPAVAQGTITFANTVLSRVTMSAPNDPCGTFIPVPLGAPIVYGVFWGTSADNLQLNAADLGTASTTSAGIIAATSPYQIAGGAPGMTVYMKIAGWTASFSRDFAAAKVTPGSVYGETGIRAITLAPTAGPGTVIWSQFNTALFQPLRLDNCPEPSTVVLIGVGAIALAWRQWVNRKRQG